LGLPFAVTVVFGQSFCLFSVCVAIDPVNAGELLIQILASMITYWNNCVITDNANSGAVSNGEDSGDTHMDVSGGHGDESHSSSTRHSGESGR
jgi:hypothetical protein